MFHYVILVICNYTLLEMKEHGGICKALTLLSGLRKVGRAILKNKHLYVPYEVTVAVEYIVTKKVLALDEKHSYEKLEEHLRNYTKTMNSKGFSIGDIELIESKELL